MINEKSEKREYRKKIFFSVVIILICAMILTILIALKINPVSPLIDSEKKATRDTTVLKDFYDEKATIIKAENAKKNVANIVINIDEKTYASFDDIIKFFNSTDTFRTKMSLALQSDYNTEEDRQAIIDGYIAFGNNMGMTFNDALVRHLLSDISLLEYENFKNKYKVIFTGIQAKEIGKDNIADNAELVTQELKKIFSDDSIILFSEQVTARFLRDNSIVDIEATNALKDSVYEDVINNYPVIIKKGTRLTVKGETVSENNIRLLEDMSLFKNQNYVILLSGIFVLIGLMLLPIFAFKKMILKKYDMNVKQLILICIVILILFAFAYFIPSNYYLIIPILIVPMLLSMLTDYKLAIIITVPLAILLTIMLNASVEYMTIVIIGSIISVFLVKSTNNRLKYALSGIIVGFLNIIILLTISLINNIQIQSILNDFAFMAIASIISSVIALGLLPVFESLFNIITPFKLLELSNPSQPLINRLLLEAPGTYHHSLMVGNLAETGAEAVGANGLLARVGAYYHDIGKLNRPAFFSENQTTKSNPHDKMTPSLSTFVIINHPKDGEELAKKNKLPHIIRNIIIEHHGTTLVQYFYHKASQTEKVNERDFRYPGPRPTTKESAVVMLADSVEASVRSMNKTSKGEIEGYIRKLIKERLEDGQLDLCDLTLKDLDDIADAFTRVFSGYFHSRIQYPDKIEVSNDEDKG
ncbi:MAG: HDIG domain-containing protein [Clostridia bacterium]|nr:HDIG domain-containing protein [Clostridia bacterium]